jgi:hypothetical protein
MTYTAHDREQQGCVLGQEQVRVELLMLTGNAKMAGIEPHLGTLAWFDAHQCMSHIYSHNNHKLTLILNLFYHCQECLLNIQCSTFFSGWGHCDKQWAGTSKYGNEMHCSGGRWHSEQEFPNMEMLTKSISKHIFPKSKFLLNPVGILHIMKDIWIGMEGNSCVVEWACWKL